MARITSRQNSIVARYRAAARGEDGGPLLLDGPHLVGEALAAGVELLHVMVAADAPRHAETETLVARATARGVEVALCSAAVMDAVSPVRSSSAIVALAVRPALAARMFSGGHPVIAIACDVQDPGNLGAMARVAEAAGAAGLIAAGHGADPFGWKALRGSMGSALRLPIATAPSAESAVAAARAHGCRVFAAVPRTGVPLFGLDLRGPAAILIGGEGGGLPPALVASADERVTIPMDAPVESLNAAVTAALILYEARRRRS